MVSRVAGSQWLGAEAGILFSMIQRVAEIRSAVALPMVRRGIVRAGVFGSLARGEARADSDVDFMVEFEPGRTLVDLAGLRLDLCEVLSREVDVATPRSLHPLIREQVMTELVSVL